MAASPPAASSRAAASPALYSPDRAGLPRPARPGHACGRSALGPLIYAGFDRLDAVNNRGSTLDVYSQNSRNYAFFTHNIFHITDQFDLTLGLRYTNERKDFDATFGNDNTVCPAQQAALVAVPAAESPALRGALGAAA